MNSKLLKNVLDWALATGVLLSVIFLIQFYNRSRNLRELNVNFQANLSQLQNNRQIFNAVMTDTMEYNRQHPDANLTRILESLRPSTNQAAARPATAK